MQAPKKLFAPFTSQDWLYELKHDGYRCMAGVQAGEVRLLTKSGTDCTKWSPEVVKALASLPGGPHVIDGEACVLRSDGRR
jgi:ATP-dependent DNA ligase